MGKFIDQLIRDGNLVLWHDYRRGHFDDLSGNENHGTPSTGVRWEGHALRFPAVTDEVTVADSAELRLTTGTIIALGRFNSMVSDETLVAHINTGPIGYRFWLDSATRLRFRGDGVIVDLTVSVIGRRCAGVTFASGETPIGYVDGVLAGNFSGAVTVTAATDITEIGNFINSSNFLSTFESMMILSRILTETEMAIVYYELADMEHTSLVDMRSIADITAAPLMPVNDLWKTNFGAQTSVAAVTSGYLGNTPVRVESGSFKISTEIIDGEPMKFIECVTAGLVRIPVTQFGQTPTEAAYGELDLWVSKPTASDLDIILGDAIEIWSGANQDGYLLRLNFAERIALIKLVGGVDTELFYTDPDEVAVDTLTWLRLTRSLAGVFTVYKNGVIVGNIAFGTNPVTDTTHTTINYLLFDLDAGDKIAYSDPVGGHSIVKRVVS